MKKFQDYDRKGVAERLKRLRRASGFTLTEAADKAGISFSQISKLETGGGQMGMDSLIRLADLYRVPRDWILIGAENAPGASPISVAESAGKSAVGGAAPDLVRRLSNLVCDDRTMVQAKEIAASLQCPVPEALAIVLRHALEK